MGLDAWIYSGEKPDIERLPIKPHTNDLDKLDYTYFIKDDIKDISTIQDLLPICVEKLGTTICIDWDRFKKENDIPLNTRCGGYTKEINEITQYFYDENNKQYSLTLSNLKFNSYEIEKDVHLYITRLNEISYFRNEWGLDIEIGTIYNELNDNNNQMKRDGYYHLNKDIIHELNLNNKLFAEEYFCEEDNSLYYHTK